MIADDMPPFMRPLKAHVHVHLQRNANSTIQYEVVRDDHYYENGFRATWVQALERASVALAELSVDEGLNTSPDLPEGTE